MDAEYEVQFRLMQRALAERNVRIEVELGPGGDLAYVFQVGRLLAVDEPGNIRRIQRVLRGARRTDEPTPRGLVVLSIDNLRDGYRTVPQALDVLEEALGADNPALHGELPLATPNHLLHITRLCQAVEPDVPAGQTQGQPVDPWPLPCPPIPNAPQVQLAVLDTGLIDNLGGYPWMTDVGGDKDAPLVPLPGPTNGIPLYVGHGTFVAGVAKCMAPSAQVEVKNVFPGGGALESQIAINIENVIQQQPGIKLINVSAGTYTRDDWPLLGLATFPQTHPDVVLVGAAGNESTDRPFYPAAFDWAISVGALAASQQNRAWFSNHGPYVDVYALGDGVVNAFPTGEYTYQWPPKAPAVQHFSGMARWAGTSFAAPLVTGLIASRMARANETAVVAAQVVKAAAGMQSITGVGPVLHPCDQP